MDLATLIFWIIAVILVGSALMVVSLRNIVHSAIALVLVFAMAAGIYVLLNAEFIAIVQILIYAGAVTILILFALMLTRIRGETITNPTNRQWWVAVIIAVLVGASIVYAATTSGLAVSNVSNGVSQLPAHIILDVGYVGTQGRHLARGRDLNQLPAGTLTQPQNKGVNANALRPYLGFGAIRLSENAGRSTYNGLQLSVDRRPVRWAQLGAALCARSQIRKQARQSQEPNLEIARHRPLASLSLRERVHAGNQHSEQ